MIPSSKKLTNEMSIIFREVSRFLVKIYLLYIKNPTAKSFILYFIEKTILLRFTCKDEYVYIYTPKKKAIYFSNKKTLKKGFLSSNNIFTQLLK